MVLPKIIKNFVSSFCSLTAFLPAFFGHLGQRGQVSEKNNYFVESDKSIVGRKVSFGREGYTQRPWHLCNMVVLKHCKSECLYNFFNDIQYIF